MFLRGSFTALATPFTPHGLDEKAFASFVEWQIGAGTQGLVPCGTTGEGPTLTAAERDRLIRICVERAAGCVPVMAGTGTNCTATTIEQTRAAQSAGADAALVVTPYYNRPTQEGLYRHYAAVASAVDLPTSSTTYRRGRASTSTSARSNNSRPSPRSSASRTRAGIPGVRARRHWWRATVSSSSAATMRVRSPSISPVAEVASRWWPMSRPALCRALQQACRVKDWAQARSIQNSLDPLIAALAREPNPGPIKQALSLLRPEFSREPRLPLVGVAPGTASAIEHALRGLDPGMLPAGQRAA